MSALIRPESTADHEAIRHVNRLAFGQDDEARLVDALGDGGYVRVSLVAETEGKVVGHILFSDLPIITRAGTVPALALAPMAVLPELQRQGIGSALVHKGLETCQQQGHRIVVVLGHPHFYQRFGFSANMAAHLESPFSGSDSFMAVELVPGALDGVAGLVQYPPPFDGVPIIRPICFDDQTEWARMRGLLWADETADEHAKEVVAFFDKKSFIDSPLRHDVDLTRMPETLRPHSGRLFGSGQQKHLRKQGKTAASAIPAWNVRYLLFVLQKDMLCVFEASGVARVGVTPARRHQTPWPGIRIQYFTHGQVSGAGARNQTMPSGCGNFL